MITVLRMWPNLEQDCGFVNLSLNMATVLRMWPNLEQDTVVILVLTVALWPFLS